MQNDSLPICRVCLKTSLEYIDLESSFDLDHTNVASDIDSISTIDVDSQNSKKLTYMDCFIECTRLNMEINGHVPQSICVACGLDLRVAYEFLKKAEKAALFLQEYIEKDLDNLRQIEKVNDEGLSCSPLMMEEAIKTEDRETEEAYELDEALSEIEEEPKQYVVDNNLDIIPKTQSDDDIIDVLELKEFISDGENDQRDTENFLEVIVIDNEKNDNIDQRKEYTNTQEQREKSTLYKETTGTLKVKKAKRLRKIKKLRGARNNKNVSSSESSNNCKLCQSSLKDRNLSEHMAKFHMHIEECPHCEYKDKEYKVREHEKLKHADKNNYHCYVCSKTYFTIGLLNAHLKYHERKQLNVKSDACEICGKKFSSQHYLRRHLEVHRNERSLYKCEQCDKLYVTKYALDNHIKMHTGETVKCVECDKQFSRQYELNVHMRFHTRDYPFSCEVCGKKFAIKGHLRSHMWRHQGLKLQCEDCGKLFTSSKALLEHSYTHTEMPFPCCYCPKAYPSRQKFKVHLKTAHSILLNEEELRKVTGSIVKKPLPRKKLTLVQADSVMKEVEVKTKDEETEDIEDLVVELF